METNLELLKRLKEMHVLKLEYDTLKAEADLLQDETEILMLVGLSSTDMETLRYIRERITFINDRMGAVTKSMKALNYKLENRKLQESAVSDLLKTFNKN